MWPGTRRTISFFAVGSVVLALAIAGRSREEGRGRAVPSAVAERRSLEISLVEPGTLEAARSVTLASEIRSNRAKIVSLLADGTSVEPGEMVVKFDRTPFEEDRAKAAADFRDAEGAAIRAEQERKLQIARAEEALESARHADKISRLNLDAYEKGGGALAVREAEVRAAESGGELDRQRRDLADLEDMFRRGFVSQGELDRQRLKLEDLERQSGLQQDRLKTAREVIFPRDLERARTEVQEAKGALTRAEAVLYHTHEFYEAAVESTHRKVESAREVLRIADEELGKTELTSPLRGFLVLQDIPLESGKRKPQVGDSVWSGQAIATIPDLSQMVTLTRVREIDLHLVREGLDARVAIEAYPDLTVGGRIDFVGNLAEAAADSPWKFFSVRLRLDRADPRMRPGMSARVSFLLDSVKDAVVVPLDGVFTSGDRAVCYVRRRGEIWEQPVFLGRRNETHVEVKSGIAPGEELLLAPPEGRARRVEPAEPSA